MTPPGTALRKSQRAARESLARQEIADLLQQNLLARWRRRRLCLLLSPDPLNEIDKQEQHRSDDRKVDDDGEEVSPRQHRALLLGLHEGVGSDLARQWNEVIAEIEAARDR